MKIAFVGIAGVGKDFLADTMVNEYRYTKLSFARELKRIVSNIFNMPIDIADNMKDVPKYNGHSARDIWIEMAKAIRKIDDMYFVNKLLETMGKIRCDNIVVSDVRRLNELKALKQKGFVIVYVKGMPKRIKNDYDKSVPKLKGHCDFIFHNEFDGTAKFKKFLKEELKCV